MTKDCRILAVTAVALCVAVSTSGRAMAQAAPAPNGIALPADYKDWRAISVSQRTDNNTLRVILGNDIALKAARSGSTNPWPDGAALGKVVWKLDKDPSWQPATIPGELVHVEIMVRDSRKHAATGNWGYARWRGMALQPHGENAGFAQECFACHTAVKGKDYVFTRPAPMP
jgi:hypothetical protein